MICLAGTCFETAVVYCLGVIEWVILIFCIVACYIMLWTLSKGLMTAELHLLWL